MFFVKEVLTTLAVLGAVFLTPMLAHAQPLKVASYNVWGLPEPLLRHAERFESIPSALDELDADVILIQEAFTARAEPLTRLRNFPYVAHGPGSKFMHFSSGLLILSRYPIAETAQISYSRCGGFDCFSNKGAIYARVLVPGVGSVSVFNTHLNANGHDAVRMRQAEHLMRFVRVYSQGYPTVVGGDLNGNDPSLFKKIQERFFLRNAHAEFLQTDPIVSQLDRDAYTADPLSNFYLKRSETRRKLDHLFLMDGERGVFWTVKKAGLFFDGKKGRVLSDHFGIQVNAEVSGPFGTKDTMARTAD